MNALLKTYAETYRQIQATGDDATRRELLIKKLHIVNELNKLWQKLPRGKSKNQTKAQVRQGMADVAAEYTSPEPAIQTQD